MAKLEIDDVTMRFGDVVAVDRASLSVADGETVVLLGPSGCGKTTLLRLIAGFYRPKSGEIRISGRTVASPTLMVPPEKRSLSMVFQSYAVWPHKTVFENLAYGLRLRRLDSKAIEAKVAEALATVRMEDYAARYPSELSGGQQQRVAVARALVLEPEILLFDEPLSNLDATLREHMRFEIKALLGKLNISAIYVTHDQNEAMVIADRVAVMNRGRIEQIGTPEDVYYRSATDFVAQFIGLANVLDGEVVGSAPPDLVKVRLNGVGEVLARSTSRNTAQARVLVRPEQIALTSSPVAGMNTLKGRVTRRSFVGAQTDYVIDVNGVPLRVISPSRSAGYRLSEDVLVSFAPADCLLLGA
jgi:iron(III) transport system ATP-binding protein